MEFWDIYDEKGIFTGKITAAHESLSKGEYHLCSSLWILNNSGKILIQKRAETKKTGANKWSITGGSVKAGESSIQGCTREVREELGILINSSDIIFLERCFYENYIYDDYIAVCDQNINIVLQKEEVSEIKWVTTNQIDQLFISNSFMYIKSEWLKVRDYINATFKKEFNVLCKHASKTYCLPKTNS